MAKVSSELDVVIEATVTIKAKALFEPDVALFAKQPMKQGFLAIADVRLAIEVADTCLERDLRKAADYAAAGLP
mgnify:CR=1 FL=1